MNLFEASQVEWVIAGAYKYYQFVKIDDNKYRIICKDKDDKEVTKIRFVTKEIYEFLYSYINYRHYDTLVELKPNPNGLWDKLYVMDFPVTFDNDSVCFNGKKYKNGAEVYAYLEKNAGRLERKWRKMRTQELECFARKLEKRYGIQFDIDFSNINIKLSRKGYYEYAVGGYPYLNRTSVFNLAIALKESKENDSVNIETKEQYSGYFQDIERETRVKCGDVAIDNFMGCFCLSPKEFVTKLKAMKVS